jgi:hypothetical protein
MALEARVMLEELDFVYTPSRDPAADRDYFVNVLGASEVFAIEAGAERVAAVRLGEGPLLLFAGHLEGERPFLIYRVDDFDTALRDIEERGWEPAERFEIPHGPCCTFSTPGGHRVGVYQLTRPDVAEHFAGRHDF